LIIVVVKICIFKKRCIWLNSVPTNIWCFRKSFRRSLRQTGATGKIEEEIWFFVQRRSNDALRGEDWPGIDPVGTQ
jgi:hypothetical protein